MTEEEASEAATAGCTLLLGMMEATSLNLLPLPVQLLGIARAVATLLGQLTVSERMTMMSAFKIALDQSTKEVVEHQAGKGKGLIVPDGAKLN